MLEGSLDGLLLRGYWYLVHKFPGSILGCNVMFTGLYQFSHLSLSYRSVCLPVLRVLHVEMNSVVAPCSTRMPKISRWPVGTEHLDGSRLFCPSGADFITHGAVVGADLGLLRLRCRPVHC